MSVIKQTTEINERIRDAQVRLLDADGAQLGIMSARDAYLLAVQKNLDLVKISPTAVPPVCKIMDYGKYRFEQSKREKEARKHQHVVEIKEIRLSSSIDVHDFDFKLRNGIRFLKDGNKLKVSVRFHGRQLVHTGLGEKQLRKFADGCAEVANVEKPPILEGRRMSMFLAPKATKEPGKEAPKEAPKEAGKQGQGSALSENTRKENLCSCLKLKHIQARPSVSN